MDKIRTGAQTPTPVSGKLMPQPLPPASVAQRDQQNQPGVNQALRRHQAGWQECDL